MITQKELALMAGVSRPALSMYLNSPTTSHLSEAKKRKIDELFRKYNYRPNLAARSLQGKKLQIAGIAGNLFSIPIHSSIIAALNRKLLENGYQAMLGDFSASTDDDYVERVVQEFNWRKVDLLFLFNDFPSGKMIDFPGPVIRITENHTEFDLCTDLHLAGQLAAEHLLACGRRRLAYLAMPSSSGGRRPDGMLAALHKAGISATLADLVLHLDETLPEKIRDRKIDGIFCVNEFVAAQLYQQLHAMNCRIPEDISVVGFDGLPLGQILEPPLTTIEQPVEEIADAAVALMHARLAGEEPAPIRWLSPRLIVRQSTISKNPEA
jgi:DNA-binding LacI/PurR family transcriptional regulator